MLVPVLVVDGVIVLTVLKAVRESLKGVRQEGNG